MIRAIDGNLDVDLAFSSLLALAAFPFIAQPVLERALGISYDAAFRALFSKSPVKRIGRDRFVRNVLYAIGNSADAGLIPAAERLLDDPDAVVRDAAEWAVERLRRA